MVPTYSEFRKMWREVEIPNEVDLQKELDKGKEYVHGFYSLAGLKTMEVIKAKPKGQVLLIYF
jgi:hypothetical protein